MKRESPANNEEELAAGLPRFRDFDDDGLEFKRHSLRIGLRFADAQHSVYVRRLYVCTRIQLGVASQLRLGGLSSTLDAAGVIRIP